jgi:hypothetical protein
MRIHDPIARNLAAFDFQELAPFNDGAFCMYYGDQGDQSDWELHPDTDELLMVLEGSVTVEILTATDRHLLPLTAAQFAVVPKDHCTPTPTTWSRCSSPRAPRWSALPTIPGSRPRKPLSPT